MVRDSTSDSRCLSEGTLCNSCGIPTRSYISLAVVYKVIHTSSEYTSGPLIGRSNLGRISTSSPITHAWQDDSKRQFLAVSEEGVVEYLITPNTPRLLIKFGWLMYSKRLKKIWCVLSRTNVRPSGIYGKLSNCSAGRFAPGLRCSEYSLPRKMDLPSIVSCHCPQTTRINAWRNSLGEHRQLGRPFSLPLGLCWHLTTR